MPTPFSSDDADDLRQAERDVAAALGGLDLDFAALLAVSNIFRAATAVRNHMEGAILKRRDLSWSAFVVMFVLRVWGEREPRQLAAEAGISPGTLTGVLHTLERKGLARRKPHRTDGRRLLVAPTAKGRRAVDAILPAFNREEIVVTRDLTGTDVAELSRLLRALLRTLDDIDR